MNHVLLAGYCGLSFLIGALPLIGWVTRLGTGKKLDRLGTRNISVSAAFYHGGTFIGILSVLMEASKGVGVVLLAANWFPQQPSIQLLGLIALVLGRFWLGKGAGTTNVVWGIVAFDWPIAFFVFLSSAAIFILQGDRTFAKYGVLFLLPLVMAIQTQNLTHTCLALVLSVILAWVYRQLPDDLALPKNQARNKAMFNVLVGSLPANSLNEPLDADKVGQKAANLAQLMAWGYTVPPGWVLLPGDDPITFAARFDPSPEQPLVVRSSAVGEDTLQASAAGLYDSILDVTSQALLWDAIALCQDSFDHSRAVHYRQTHGLQDSALAVLVQPQIKGLFSGVAFSRDPIDSHLDQVVIEWLPGAASQVVSGEYTPQRTSVQWGDDPDTHRTVPRVVNQQKTLVQSSQSQIPEAVLLEVASLVRELEARYHGIPQDLEWTFDGETVWVLQSRPITTLLPIWTRKIAAEVIPGIIHPLTWSINQPMTCQVWGNLFTLVLGQKNAQDLAFQSTAELHYDRAYFNATLLGEIFIRMGLPPESLEFLTYDAPMSPPKAMAMLKTLPGFWRLLQKELSLPKTFDRLYHSRVRGLLDQLEQVPPTSLEMSALGDRIHKILALLTVITEFQIMAPLSFLARTKLFKIPETQLDASQNPEIQAMNRLSQLAQELSSHWKKNHPSADSFTLEGAEALIQQDPHVKAQWTAFLDEFGYLSPVGTDISVPTWQENPTVLIQSLLALIGASDSPRSQRPKLPRLSVKARSVQQRFDLKGQVAEVYNRLLAHLRWSFVALEQQWLHAHFLESVDDIFFLTYPEIQALITRFSKGGFDPSETPSEEIREASMDEQSEFLERVRTNIQRRKQDFETAQSLQNVPPIVYGRAVSMGSLFAAPMEAHSGSLSGIGASAGLAEGEIFLVPSLTEIPTGISRNTILVVPFTDAGWAPIFSQAGGIISDVGGRLSHGAIMAREYGIPAVMDVKQATQRLRNGQKVRIDGARGIVELL